MDLPIRYAIHIRNSHGVLLNNPLSRSFSLGGGVRFPTFDEAQTKLDDVVRVNKLINRNNPTLPPEPTDLEVVIIRTTFEIVTAPSAEAAA